MLPSPSSTGSGWSGSAPAPPGVLCRNEDGQRLRFEILVRVVEDEGKAGGVTINDLGCGYAAIFDFLAPLPVM